MKKGTWYALGAYVIWGLFPIYWKWLLAVPALQLLGHRILWSCVILAGIILFTRQWGVFRATALKLPLLCIYSLAALLIALNWLIYVWAVNAGFIIEASLGYFINPLLSVLLGVLFLRERLRAGQWFPISLAALGVFYLTLTYGRLPWIALTLATSFGLYGLIKKIAPLGSLYGLSLETALLFWPAFFYLFYTDRMGYGAFLHRGAFTDFLLFGAGVITTIPLLLFASAVRRIPLSIAGIMQYITPTLQFLLGALIYREPFGYNKLIGFAIVWLALILFGLEGFLVHQKQRFMTVHGVSRKPEEKNKRSLGEGR
ncbi:MAG: EamA family transporter RarD [Thermodesulfobacteriota bacterium]